MSTGSEDNGGPGARTPGPTGRAEQPLSLKDILADVAAGRLDPDEAARLLEATEQRGPVAEVAEPTPAPTSTNVARVRLRALGRRVKLIGEPFVKTVAIDGPHVVKHEGDTLIVTSEGELGASLDGFTLLRTRSFRDIQERIFGLGRELAVRVNPALAVEAEITGGSLSVERLPGIEQVRLTAGSARVRDVDGPFDLLVQAGSAFVEGKLTKGRTRLRGESGSLQVHLLPGSDVRIRHDIQLGRIVWEPSGGEKAERVLGAGTATLDLEVVMGQVTVKEATSR